MKVSEMVDEAWMEAASKYTIDFGGSNLFRVANLAASDYADRHPDTDEILIPFIAGALYERFLAFTREVLKKREG